MEKVSLSVNSASNILCGIAGESHIENWGRNYGRCSIQLTLCPSTMYKSHLETTVVSSSVYLWWKLLEHLLEIEAGGSNSLSQDVDCLMGSYMPPCPPWTDWYNCFHFFLYVPSAKTSESNLSDKQEGSNYVFQFIFCSFTIMDIPYMLKYLGMITILWHLVTLAKCRTAKTTYICKF